MNSTIERRYVPASDVTATKTSGSGMMLRGHALVFDSLSQRIPTRTGGFYERVAPGAVSRTLADRQNDVLGLYNHDNAEVLARRSAGTLRLTEDRKGLAFELDVPRTTRGLDVFELVSTRALQGMSFAFIARKDSFADVNGEIHGRYSTSTSLKCRSFPRRHTATPP